MKALEITNPEVKRKTLLRMAEKIPGAWIGIRIAGLLLLLSGWNSTKIAELFGLTRWAVVKWIRAANERGVDMLEDKPRSGRPPRYDSTVLAELEGALLKTPKDFGLNRSRWDGVVVAEYMRRFHSVEIHVRHAQRLIKKLGYTLRRPSYQYAQAVDTGVKEFGEELKKTPSGLEE